MAYLRANSLFYDCKWFLCCRIWFMWQYGHIWVNIMFTDDLVPSWHQNICNHNDGMSRRENISKGLKKCFFRDTFFQYYMHEYSISLYMIISDSYYISVCNYHITKLRLVPSTLESKFIYVNSLRPSDAYMRQETNHHWFRQWLVAWPAPSHCLNQWWNINNWTLRNKLQWNFNQNSNNLFQENALKNCHLQNGGHFVLASMS